MPSAVPHQPTPDRLLVVVTGPPATGKTTLSRRIARELRAPLLAKDAIKESLFGTLGAADRARSREVGAAAFELLFEQLEQQLELVPVVVVEANFHADAAEPRLAALIERAEAKVVQIYCFDEPSAIVERFRRRAPDRHRGHADIEALPEVVAGLATRRWRPLDVHGETVEVRFPASDVDVGALVGRLRRAAFE